MNNYNVKNKNVVFTFAIFSVIVFFFFIYFEVNIFDAQTVKTKVLYPEIQKLVGKNLSFNELSDFFKYLAKDNGARYAFEVLKNAELPPRIDLHLLGHIVGDELFKQEGVKGIEACTRDFRNACSHSIVVGLFSERGDMALDEIAEVCRRSPGGLGAYTMCFHGLGHGILAAVGYTMEKTVDLCKKTATPQYKNRESVECIGGAVMEIVGGGFHDREIWQKQRLVYLDSTKPLELCENNIIPQDAKGICYMYITPYLIEAAGGNIGNPLPEDIALVQKIRIEKKDLQNFCRRFKGEEKNSCLSEGWPLFAEQVKTPAGLIEFCAWLSDPQSVHSCVYDLFYIVTVQFGLDGDRMRTFCQEVAENYRGLCFATVAARFMEVDNDFARDAVLFCKSADTAGVGKECYEKIISSARYSFRSRSEEARNVCGMMPLVWQNQCLQKINQ